jgi:dolichyl-diphosphooligosaccharide--protein glycosyltransferase
MLEQARDTRVRQVAQGLLLFSLALVVRAIPMGQVLEPGIVHFPFGADEFYHLRRIWFGVQNFPSLIDFDSYLNFPDGARAVWPPVFDWVLAAIARVLIGTGDQLAMERLLAWAPPVLGGLTVVCVWRIGRELFSSAAGLVAGVLLALLPAHYANSQLGQIDHHVAVALTTSLLLWSALRLLADRPSTPGRWIGMGATGALAMLLWPGALIHLAIVQVAAVFWLLVAGTREQAVSRCRILAVNHGVAFAALLPFCIGQSWQEFSPLSPLVLGRFQPLWLGAATVTLFAMGVLWSRSGLGATRRQRVSSALALGAAGVALALVAIPGLLEAIDYASGWFTEDEAFQSTVLELGSLTHAGGEFVPQLANSRFSMLFWIFPIAWLGLALDARAHANAAARGLLLLWALAFLAATLLQFRFLNTFSVAFALVLGGAAPALVRRVEAWLGRIPAVATALLLVVASLVAFLPVLDFYRPEFVNSRRVLAGKRLRLPRYNRIVRVVERSSRWLRENSPLTAGYLAPAEAPGYGVLANWGIGHHVRYRSERPMPQDNFGVYGGRANYELSEAYYAARSEDEALAVAAQLGVRYVTADPGGSGQAQGYPGQAMTFRLITQLGSAGPLGNANNPALGHHRLIYLDDDRDMMPRRSKIKPYRFAIFEIVEGARAVGRAEPGSTVEVTLELQLPRDERHTYLSSAEVGPDGGYELRLPYPTSSAGGASGSTDPTGPGGPVLAAGRYQLRSGERTVALDLSEEDVRSGRTVRAPDLD